MFRRIPRVRQHDATDCGAACLSCVAMYHGLRLPIARIRQYASTDLTGTTALGLVDAAGKLGFAAKGVKGTTDSLRKIPLPAIAHLVRGPLRHFVVICRVSDNGVVLMDPADGRLHRLSHQEFTRRWSGVLVLLVPSEEFRPRNERALVIERFWELVSPHRTVLAQALLGAAVYTVLGLSTSIYVQKILDHVLTDGNRNLLNLMSVAMLLLLIAQLWIGAMKSVLTLDTGQRIDARLILGYYKHLLTLPQRFFDTMRVGEITSRVSDAVKIRAFINDVAIEMVVNVLIVVFSLALIFLYSWMLALLISCIVPLYAVIYAVTNSRNRRNARQLMERAADLQTQLVESVTAVSTIKLFGLEEYANLQTETRFVRLLRSVLGAARTAITASSASQFVSRLSIIALLWSGAHIALDQQMTPGELISCYALLGYLTGPITSLISLNRTAQEALIAADRLFEIMDLEREEQRPEMKLTPKMAGDIEFQSVSFRYGSHVEVFREFTLRIARGHLTAIVGESGSGKSTLTALVQRLYPVNAGQIRIGGYDIRHISLESLRQVIGAVPQRIDLLAGSVIENIALGEFEPDIARVLEVSRALGISEFVEKLPQAFGTDLGQNGSVLSGGERQRIAIARALYRDPEILLLDEATSSLDSISEQYVRRVIDTLRLKGKTVIVIAHRLSTVMYADRIVVLAGGAVVEEGTHEDLLRRRSTYHALWRHQSPEMVA